MLSGYRHVQNQESWYGMKHEFRSGFARQIREMLKHRAAMGYSVDNYCSILTNFDQIGRASCRERV